MTLQWDAVAGADHYQVERKGAAGQYTFTNVPATATTFADTGVSSGAACLYWVRAVDGTGGTSAFSNVALGTAYSFTDNLIITLADDPSGATVTKVLPYTSRNCARPSTP